MSLAGNLEIFPLDEVMLMLTRSEKSGCLRIEAPSTQGRIYLREGAITLSTVGTDEDFKRQLVLAALVDDDGLRNVEDGSSSLLEEGLPGAPEGELESFLREHSIESLHRIHRHRSGDFDFVVDLTPRYRTGLTIDPPTLLALSERRADEWAEIESVVPDLNARYRMIRRLPSEEAVSVNPSTWYILSALEGGTSVHGLAAALGVSSFKAAYELAHLVRHQLVEEVVTKRGLRTQLADEMDSEETTLTAAVAAEEPTPFVEGPGTSQEPLVVTEPASVPEPIVHNVASDIGADIGTPDVGIPGVSTPDVSITEVTSDHWGTGSRDASTASTPVAPVDEQNAASDPAAHAWPAPDVVPAEADKRLDDPWSRDDSDAAVSHGDQGLSVVPEPAATADVSFELPDLPEAGGLPPVAEAPPAPESRFPADDDSWWNSWSADLDDEPADAVGEPALSVEQMPVDQAGGEPSAAENQDPNVADSSSRWWAQTMDEVVEEPQTDSPEFLEGVFDAVSADDDTEEDAQETGFGRGLLRRRLMGSVPRDNDETR